MSLNPGSVTDFYDLSNKVLVGKGQFGEVWRIQTKDGATVACKLCLVALNSWPKTQRELAVGAQSNHDAVLDLQEYFVEQGPRQVKVHMIMRFCAGGTLLDYLMKLPPKQMLDDQACKDIFARLVMGMHSMHALKIAHRDLKPDNVMMLLEKDPMSTVIGDFGFAKQFNSTNDNTSTVLGTHGYMAPELVNLSRKGEYNGFSVDMFAMGVILYEICVKKPPWALNEGADPVRWNSLPEDQKFPSRYGWDNVDPAAKELVMALLQLDPKLRPTTYEVLHHQWLSNAKDVPEFLATAEAPVAVAAQGNNRGQEPIKETGDGCCVMC